MSLTSMDIARAKKDQLRKCLHQIAPEIFSEEAVDIDELKRSLGEWVDPGKERFGLTWPGKDECMKIIQQPSVATLKPVREESANFDETENLFIEGDNLEVLKLLQKAYFGKIKMIYIDPPYNTGKEFIYPDKYAETLESYLEYTGQKDGGGRKFSTNTDTSGRYHSRWLNMMHPRLYLARNLLREDGVIFISIDDCEVANLRALCDQLFGEENFVANAVWQKKYTRANDARWFSDNHDHILIYARNKESFQVNALPRTEEQLKAYSNPDNHPKGPWKATPLHAKSGRNTAMFAFSNGITWSPPKGTYRRFNDDTMNTLDEGDEVWFGTDGKQIPSRKSFLSEVKDGVIPTTIWTYQEAGHNHEATNDLKDLGLGGLFDNPKPVRLLKLMETLATNAEDEEIILDFFAGSSTTGQATYEKNYTDNGRRKFILVQLPEPCNEKSEAFKAGFKTIADIGKERIRRAGKKITEKSEGQLDLDGTAKSDLGFKVFKLDRSNFKIWNGDAAADDDLAKQLEMHVNHVSDVSGPEDILYELLLKAGFALTTKVETVELAGKPVFSIEDGALLICLEKEITSELIDAMAEANTLQVICLDEGFKGNDQLKANAVQTFKARAQSEESEIVFRTV